MRALDEATRNRGGRTALVGESATRGDLRAADASGAAALVSTRISLCRRDADSRRRQAHATGTALVPTDEVRTSLPAHAPYSWPAHYPLNPGGDSATRWRHVRPLSESGYEGEFHKPSEACAWRTFLGTR